MTRPERHRLHDHSDDNSGGRLAAQHISGLPSSSTTIVASGGAAVLNDLGDVDLVTTPPADNDALTYDSASGQWIPAASSGATFGTPALTLGTSNTAGSTDEAIRRDATILAFDATVPVTQASGDAAATGAAAVAARRDHKHGMPTIAALSASTPVQDGGAGGAGSGTAASKDDHKHPGDKVAIVAVIDGGGVAITTGVKLDLQIPWACTITAWSILLDISGSIVFDVWKDTEANYPPVVGDSITAAAKPTVTTTTKNSSSTLTGWTTSVTAGDTLRFNVDSITSATRATLTLTATRT